MSKGRKQVDVFDENEELLEQYESIQAAAMHYGVNHCTILYWIGAQRPKNGRIFRFHNEEYSSSRHIYRYYHVKATDDKVLDKENNTILKYEVINKRVSITPCPFKEYPKPMVGSGLCVRCNSFRGRNRKDHEVACCRINI